jgi:hypothetical protein
MSDAAYNSQVNPQIVDAVTKTNQFAGLGARAAAPSATAAATVTAGGTIAFEKAAQAAALAVQDGVDYQRNIMSLSTVAQGKALALMFADQSKLEQYAAIFVLAAIAPIVATLTSAAVNELEGLTVGSFKDNIDA